MNNRVRQIRRYKKMFAKHYDFLIWLTIEKLWEDEFGRGRADNE